MTTYPPPDDTFPQGRRKQPGWQDVKYLSLMAIQVVLLLTVVAYALWPPVAASPVESDRWLVLVTVALVAVTAFVTPQLPPWGLDFTVVCTWLLIAGLSITRATGQGQLALGLSVLALAVYMIYYLPTGRAFVEIVVMTVVYGATMILNSHIVGPFILVLTVVTLIVAAVVAGGLRETDRRHRLLIENAGDVVFHSDRGVVQWISPSAAQVLGWTPDELVGTSIHRLWHPDDLDSALSVRDAAYRGVEGMGVFRFLTGHRDYRWIEISFKPYRARGHGGVIGAMRDVSERVTAEQALLASEQEYRMLAEMESDRLAQLEALHDAQARLFRNLSHELRTPIAMIQAPLYGILRSDTSASLTSDQRLDLEAATRAADRLQGLVDGILDVARGRAGQLVVVAEPTDVAMLTRDAVAMFRSAAEQAGLGLTVSTVAFPPVVRMDRDLWLKILFNLVSNAIKYTKFGQIAVTLHYDGAKAELRVADSGVGMSEADLSRIYDPFQQVSNRAARGEAGSGLGLTLVAELVRAIGGTIDVESTEGVGTTFTVRLPAERIDEPVPSVTAIPKPFATKWVVPMPDVSPAGSDDDGPLNPGRILLVEDHEDLRKYLSHLLRSAGWQVTGVADAESARDLVADHDLVLTDVLLPGMDGLELVRWVRRTESVRWTPVIVLTAKAGRESVIEGLNAGADDFVSKPFDPDELLARVATHVELALLRRVVLDEADSRAANLEKALSSNRVIGTALGIIMSRENVTAENAFARLREHSQRTNRKLRDVADDVVLTGELPGGPMQPAASLN